VGLMPRDEASVETIGPLMTGAQDAAAVPA